MNAKSKTFAFISTALMIGMCISAALIISEPADAYSYSHGTQNLNVGQYYSITLIEAEDLTDEEAYGIWPKSCSGSVPGMTISTHNNGVGNVYTISGVPTTSGTYTITCTVDSCEEGHYYYNNTETWTFVVIQPNYTVSFNSMGGSAVASQSVSPGGHATQPANPTNGVKVFGGWYTDQACTQAFNFATPINANITLYAKWTNPTASVTSSHGNTTMIVGQLFSYSVSTNPSNATVSVSGANWLNVSGHTVYGTPTSPGTYNITITSSASGYNNGSQSFTVTVSSVLAPSNAPSNGVIAYVR